MARKLNLSAKVVSAWETGNALPTAAQARAFATKTHIPFGYLFLSRCPKLEMPVADFRSGWTSDRNLEEEANLLDLVKLIISRKDWFENHLSQLRTGPAADAFQGTFNPTSSYGRVASSITDLLELSISDQTAGRGNPSKFWPQFRKATIDAGIWLMESSNVNGDDQRTVSPKTCRGLALKSSHHPVIWVNSALGDAAKIFTLAHDLAHIWVGCDNISNPAEECSPDTRVGKLCDDTALEVLVPESVLKSVWNHDIHPENNIEALQHYFAVGPFVLARKCHHVGILVETDFLRLRRALSRNKPSRRKVSPRNALEDTASVCADIVLRNGADFTGAVVDEYEDLNLPWTDANFLLGITCTQALIDELPNHVMRADSFSSTRL